jgi:hypothetical protein
LGDEMAKYDRSKILDVEVGGKAVRSWESLWKPLPGGFKKKHPELRNEVGLIRAVLRDEIMYIIRAAEHLTGGIEKGLQRIRGVEQTGNKSFGPQMLRQHIDEIDVEVLIVGSSYKDAEITKELKSIMIKIHDPLWNRPHTRRMNRIRAGEAV